MSTRPGHGLEGPAPRQVPEVFGEGGPAADPPVDVKTLHAKMGELALENDFLERALGEAGLLSAKR